LSTSSISSTHGLSSVNACQSRPLSLHVDGCLDLSRATARQQAARDSTAAAAATAVAAPSPAATTAAAARLPAPARADGSRAPSPAARAGIIYAGTGDSQLKPPIVVSQSAPELPRAVSEVMKRTPQKSLVLELIIDESGEVEDVTVVEPVVPVYDMLVVRTARQWKYRPATFDGVPVKFRKSVTFDFRDQ
jgi:TonB family protein